MRVADPADPLHRRALVEQDAPAPVHLDVDETGGDESAVEVAPFHVVRQLPALANRLDDAVRDHDGRVPPHRLTVEDGGSGQGEGGRQIVSVTFLRLRGVSGSRPFSRASRSANA